jgi:uncharacterized protein YjbI with pentapeptide repeats
MQNANLDGSPRRRAGLRRVRLDAGFLRYSWMDGTDLTGAWLGSADLENASLVRANLSGANLARLPEAELCLLHVVELARVDARAFRQVAALRGLA